MNRNTPLIVLSSLVGALGIYCTSTVVQSGPSGRAVGDANADSPLGSENACCNNAPQFTKLAEGDLRVTAGSGYVTTQSPDIDVSGYRQVSVLADDTGSCEIVLHHTQFRSDAASTHWGTGLPPSGLPIPVIAPIMRVTMEARSASSTSSCTRNGHYIVLGLK